MNVIIKNVTTSNEVFHIESEEGICFALSKEMIKDYIPKKGDKLFLHTFQGSRIRGIDKDGQKIYYLTDKELEEERQEWIKKEKERRRLALVKEEPILEKMFSLLPKFLQHRILMQRLYIPDFRVNEEIYEMSATFLAYKIYLHCGKSGDYDENLKNFNIIKYITNHKILSHYDMSYNQVEFAKFLAKLMEYDVKTQKIDIHNPTPEDILKSRSMKLANALSPLIGDPLSPREVFIERYVKTLNN